MHTQRDMDRHTDRKVIFTSLLFKKEKEKWFEKQNFAI
jgi:hypothetical protein